VFADVAAQNLCFVLLLMPSLSTNPSTEVASVNQISMTADEQQRPLDLERQSESEKHVASVPRFVRRNLPYFQSKNKLNVHHNQGFKIIWLVRHDWFHVLLRMKGWISTTFLLTIWTIMLLIFAAIYVWYDNKDPGVTCGLGPPGEPIQFGPAFAFSLETCTTGE
jgi:hypothetical protein